MGRKGAPPGLEAVARTIAQECVAVRLRMLGRIVTGIYDAALRPHGVRTSQVNVLTVVARRGSVTPGEVGRILCMEKSTLSRNVDRLRSRGWLETVPGDDGRSHRLQLTAAGGELLRGIFPAWRAAQRQVRAQLGREGAASIASMAGALGGRG